MKIQFSTLAKQGSELACMFLSDMANKNAIMICNLDCIGIMGVVFFGGNGYLLNMTDCAILKGRAVKASHNEGGGAKVESHGMQ